MARFFSRLLERSLSLGALFFVYPISILQSLYLLIWLIYNAISTCLLLACLRFHKLTGKVKEWKLLSKLKAIRFQSRINERNLKMKIALIIVGISLASFLTLVVVGCFAIYQAAKPLISQLELSLIQTCKTKQYAVNSNRTGDHLQKDLRDCSRTIAVSRVSGSSNSKPMDAHTITFSQIDSLNTGGLRSHGLKSFAQVTENILPLVQVSKDSEVVSVDSASMHLSIQPNKTKKPCQLCMRIKKAVSGFGA